MDVPDRGQTFQELLHAGTAMRVEEILDQAGIRLERSGQDQEQVQEFWRQLRGDLDRSGPTEKSFLGFNRLTGYARAAIKARENR